MQTVVTSDNNYVVCCFLSFFFFPWSGYSCMEIRGVISSTLCNLQQVIVGFDTMEMIKDMELSTPSGIGFEIEEMEDGITEVDDENKTDEDKDDEVLYYFISSFISRRRLTVTVTSGMGCCSRRRR